MVTRASDRLAKHSTLFAAALLLLCVFSSVALSSRLHALSTDLVSSERALEAIKKSYNNGEIMRSVRVCQVQ